MFAPLVLDPRLAFLFLAALILGAAVPLAFGWARVFPEEPPPFGVAENSRRPAIDNPSGGESPGKRRDPLAIVFLIYLTLSYACQIPGVLHKMGFGLIPAVIPQDATGWIAFAAIWSLVLIPGFAVAYSFLRPHFLQVPLIAAGFLIPLLWLLADPLRAALEAVR